MWSTLLPFAIYPVCGPLFTLPSTLAITYSILGLEDIGVQIEEPFNILPLRQYSDGVYDGVDFNANKLSIISGTVFEIEPTTAGAPAFSVGATQGTVKVYKEDTLAIGTLECIPRISRDSTS